MVVKFTTPVYTGGTYQLSLKAGNDGTILVDECGQEMPIQTLPFIAADTVNASFTYTAVYGCQRDTFYSHIMGHTMSIAGTGPSIL